MPLTPRQETILAAMADREIDAVERAERRRPRVAAAKAAHEKRVERLRREAARHAYGTPEYAAIVHVGDAEVQALLEAVRAEERS